MTVTDEIRHLAIERAPADRVAEVAVRNGMRRLREDGLEKVRQGVTSMAEIARVTSENFFRLFSKAAPPDLASCA
jgi:type IV pilus assembly protein PilB